MKYFVPEKCSCGGTINAIWFEEPEYDRGVRTGRVREAVSHLECNGCFKSICVDDTFDGPWRYKS